MNLLYRDNRPKRGLTTIMNSNNSPLRILSMSRLFLDSKDSEYTSNTKNKEMAINIVGGKCSIIVTSDRFGEISYADVGRREDPFSGLPTVVYMPHSSEVKIASKTDRLDAILFFAPSSLDNKPAIVQPEQVKISSVGRDNWQREVRISIADNIETQSLIMGETINPPGNWSGYPPHKHDEDRYQEYPQEEAYIFFFKSGKGFCLIRLYSPKDDELFDVTYTLKHNDAVAIPRGYHTIANAPGYEMCYFFALASKEKHFGAVSADPEHEWIKK